MPEVPGLTPKTANLGRIISDSGFTVFIPSLFGTPDKEYSLPYVSQQFIRVCISREFHVSVANHSSPISNWLRALCREVYFELGGPGIGVLGLCLTGNFALSLMVEFPVMAPPYWFLSCSQTGQLGTKRELALLNQLVAQAPSTMILGGTFYVSAYARDSWHSSCLA